MQLNYKIFTWGIFCYGLAMEWHSLNMDIPPEPSKGNLPERNQKGINPWYCKLIWSPGRKSKEKEEKPFPPDKQYPA